MGKTGTGDGKVRMRRGEDGGAEKRLNVVVDLGIYWEVVVGIEWGWVGAGRRWKVRGGVEGERVGSGGVEWG